jgi:hypothetical protein
MTFAGAGLPCFVNGACATFALRGGRCNHLVAHENLNEFYRCTGDARLLIDCPA